MSDTGRGPEGFEGHAGAIAVQVARRHGVEAMFTLSGAHVFPLYDGAVKAQPAAAADRRPARADGGVRGRGDGASSPAARGWRW